MPQTLSNSILPPLLVLAIVGAWGYAATRASRADLDTVSARVAYVEIEGDKLEEKIEADLDKLQVQVHRIDVEQSSFRAEVRSALQIPAR